jgi:sialidase-1
MLSPDAFSVTLAEATVQYPRNSEGDVIVLRDGRLLACWSRFYGGPEDHAAAHIAARLSSDGGRTWGEPFVLQENIGTQNVMSASFLRERTSGELLFFYGVKNSPSDLKFYCRRSHDEGQSWSDPVLVTPADGYNVINNARIVQLSSGRLLAPVEFCRQVYSADEHFRTVMFFSDDGGHSWQRAPGEVDAPKRGAMEPGVVELRDGRVLQIIRTQIGQILKAYSSDGGLTWSPPEPLGVAAPEAPATVVRIPTTGDLALFYNPTVDLDADHSGRRCPLSVALSSDEGLTWRRTVDLETDPRYTYAYVSCTFHGERALLTYYVAGIQLPGGVQGLSLRFVSLPIKALYGG